MGELSRSPPAGELQMLSDAEGREWVGTKGGDQAVLADLANLSPSIMTA